jgi:hypothetical protein
LFHEEFKLRAGDEIRLLSDFSLLLFFCHFSVPACLESIGFAACKKKKVFFSERTPISFFPQFPTYIGNGNCAARVASEGNVMITIF